MTARERLVAFAVDNRRVALPLSAVERVLRAVAVERLPKAPPIVLGVINVQGRIIPVMDVRRRFGLPGREVRASDHLLLARTRGREVALAVDAVAGVIEPEAGEVTEAPAILPELKYVMGVTTIDGDLIFIHDLDTFLSLEEAQRLDAALEQSAAAP